ncbi:MAG: type II toxin-antitoxin system Phd/YefM family antitoxin, partial [Candidatus Xenobia bacterium]
MTSVGIRELKNHLSEYIRRVAQGERILITDRGHVIAELCAPGPETGGPYPPGLLQLARQGRVRLGGPNRADLYDWGSVQLPAG